MVTIPKSPVRSSAGWRSGISKRSIENFKTQTTKIIAGKTEEVAQKTVDNISKAYMLGIKSRLLEGGFEQAADFNSQRLVSNLADSIYREGASVTKVFTTEYINSEGDKAFKNKYINEQGFKVVVPVDSHGLMLYLEYGTGLKGARNSDGYAERHGWNYAVNKDDYRTVEDFNPYRKEFGIWSYRYDPIVSKLGFVFTPDKFSYITKSDVDPVKFISRKEYKHKNKTWRYTKSYVRKDGTKVRGYRSKIKNKRAGEVKVYEYDYTDRYRFVWSEGIKPIRFIYETKLRLKNLLKNLDLSSGHYEPSGNSKKPFTANLGQSDLSPKAVRLLNSLSNGEWSKTGGKLWI